MKSHWEHKVPRIVEVTPSASRLTTSLRDIGYDFTAALADLVDNSISAEASQVAVDFTFRGKRSFISVADDGHGMSSSGVEEALRFGSRKHYRGGDLGRFGLGLKTASLSQCRRVTVLSRQAPKVCRVAARTLDLDRITETDRWYLYSPYPNGTTEQLKDSHLRHGPGTVVMLEKLDRVFEGVDAGSGWARRRLDKLAEEATLYLGMVFHRFIEGTASTGRVTITINGEKVEAWNPFALAEEETRALPVHRFSLGEASGSHEVTLRSYVLPPRSLFSTPAEFDRLGGPNRWNRQQGLYIYRADRMVQSGGWSGLRSIDEHTKLARVALDFPTALDEVFKINVAKMRVSIPAGLREVISRPIHEVCVLADAAYRRSSEGRKRVSRETPVRRSSDLRTVGVALESAAIRAGLLNSLDELIDRVRETDPQLAEALGF